MPWYFLLVPFAWLILYRVWRAVEPRSSPLLDKEKPHVDLHE